MGQSGDNLGCTWNSQKACSEIDMYRQKVKNLGRTANCGLITLEFFPVFRQMLPRSRIVFTKPIWEALDFQVFSHNLF